MAHLTPTSLASSPRLGVFSTEKENLSRNHSTSDSDSSNEDIDSSTKPDDTTECRRVIWPPECLQMRSLGEVYDASGNYFRRCDGRSSMMSNGYVYWQFGDTVTYDHDFKRLGLSSNTCSVSSTPLISPTLSRYFEDKRQSNKPVPDLIAKFPQERDSGAMRHVVRSLGGIIEYNQLDDVILGWTWFWRDIVTPRNNISHPRKGGYTGIACLSICGEKITVKREPKPLFRVHEPQLGTFCALRYLGYAYVYGHLGHSSRDPYDVVVGRVPLQIAKFRNSYEFWDGTHWQKDISKLKPVMFKQKCGKIFPTKMFGPDFPWAFVGTRSERPNADRLQFGRSKTLTGPWDVLSVLPVLGQGQDCIYPHPWARQGSVGDLMITLNFQRRVSAFVVRFKSEIIKKPRKEERIGQKQEDHQTRSGEPV